MSLDKQLKRLQVQVVALAGCIILLMVFSVWILISLRSQKAEAPNLQQPVQQVQQDDQQPEQEQPAPASQETQTESETSQSEELDQMIENLRGGNNQQ
jgi:flagellar biosynthesis/type III secretory pathway M-ring protein FliF/YscJ